MPPLPRQTWNRRLSAWNRRRRLVMGLATERRKYRARLHVTRAMARIEEKALSRLA